MSAPLILHVIPQFTLGGASRALLAKAAYQQGQGTAQHRIYSLAPSDPAAQARAVAASVEMVAAADSAPAMRDADIIHLHFWNTPEVWHFLSQKLPPARLVITLHVAGLHAPQLLTREVADLADLLVLTAQRSLAVVPDGQQGKAIVIPSAAELSRVTDGARAAHAGVVAGYLGTLDFTKIHNNYIGLHEELAIDHIVAAGEGPARKALMAQAAARGLTDRYSFPGHVEDIAAFFREIDIFAYPLDPHSYATTELVVHEAMAAGLPCVLFADRGGSDMIVHGETGLIVSSDEDYRTALSNLAADPGLRRRMGDAAHSHALAHFGPANLAPLLDEAYERLMEQDKCARKALPSRIGAEAFMASLGDAGSLFRQDMAEGILDSSWSELPIGLFSATAGGVQHYSRHYPGDPFLRFWSGIAFFRERRFASAAAQFRLCMDGELAARARGWMEKSITAAREATAHQ